MTYSLNTLNSDAAHHATRGLARYAQELGLLFGLIGLVFWGLALASYNLTDPAWTTSGNGSPTRNWGGGIGAFLADGSYALLGLSVWLCWACLLYTSPSPRD